jgi:hypothetical protein
VTATPLSSNPFMNDPPERPSRRPASLRKAAILVIVPPHFAKLHCNASLALRTVSFGSVLLSPSWGQAERHRPMASISRTSLSATSALQRDGEEATRATQSQRRNVSAGMSAPECQRRNVSAGMSAPECQRWKSVPQCQRKTRRWGEMSDEIIRFETRSQPARHWYTPRANLKMQG